MFGEVEAYRLRGFRFEWDRPHATEHADGQQLADESDGESHDPGEVGGPVADGPVAPWDPWKSDL